MANVKISIIGAGSGCFSVALVRDLCLTKGLAGSAVSFMDIDPERLDGAFVLCRRYADELGVKLDIEKTLDRRRSLDGASFVINTALAAPHQRLREGWKIARELGYRFGGSYHVLYDEAFWVNFYQLRLFESLTEDMLRICPDAWHLMVANPVVAGTTHIARKYRNSKMVGLCHGYAEIYRIAKALGFDREGLTYEIPGVNHFVYATHACHKGRNLLTELDRWLRTEAPKVWAAGETGALSPKRADVYRRFGAIPIGDTAGWSGAAWPWWYHSDDEVEKKWSENPEKGWNGYFDGVQKTADRLKAIAADPSVRVTKEFPPNATDELMIPLVESIACDIPRVFVCNIPNDREYVPGIPRDFEVEVPVLASGRGVEGIATRGLPKHILAHILRDRVAPVEMELEAFRKGSRDLLLQLVLMDKWTASERQANELLDRILALPYHGEMREHYR